MKESITWNVQAMNDDGPCGTLRDVVARWKSMESRDHEDVTGVTVSHPIKLEGWREPRTDLWPQHLDELADRLPRAWTA